MLNPHQPATWPIPILCKPLVGSLISLEPITFTHVPELALAGADPTVWEFTTSCGDSPGAMQAYVEKLLRDWEQGSALPFAVRQHSTGQLVGCTRLKELDRNHRRAIVGSWYAQSVWRTGVNLEAKLLLLDYAFDKLGLIRIEFHTDARNVRSRTSLERLGATLEGVLRAHQITRDGSLRDSAVYSILASEWLQVRAGIADRLLRHG